LFEDYLQRQQNSVRQGNSASNRDQDLSNSGHDGGNGEPLLADYRDRFPEQKDSMARLLQHHVLLQSMQAEGAATPSHGSSFRLALPSVGDELFDFPLRYELGRGAFARVFLAEQTGLADRPIV